MYCYQCVLNWNKCILLFLLSCDKTIQKSEINFDPNLIKNDIVYLKKNRFKTSFFKENYHSVTGISCSINCCEL